MRLSIITVNYNNPNGLRRTIESVVLQKNKDFEFIVIDGASTTGDYNIIREYEQYITYWVSEPDGGIYAAMNKGVRVATGDYCLFLNSGDTLYSENTIEEIYSINFSEDYIEGSTITINGLAKAFKRYSLSTYYYGGNNHHQASLISRTLLLSHPYDEKLKIASDLKFNVEVLVLNNCSYRPIDVIISNYEAGGRSSTIDNREEIISVFNELIPPRILEDYFYNESFYKFPVNDLRPVLKKIGDNFFLFKIKLLLKRFFNKNISPSDKKELERRKLLKNNSI